MIYCFLVVSDVDHCFGNNNPCSAHGQCVSSPGANEAQCVCNPGFRGNFCQCEFLRVLIYT